MSAQRDWCGLIGWLLAASLVALQARFVSAAENPDGPSITLNRGESYVIRNVSPDSEPEVQPIDDSRPLIVNKQPDGGVLVLGAEAGTEKVRVKLADGKVETYTVTVHGSADPNNPLAPGSGPAATSDAVSTAETSKPATTPLDAGTGPAKASAPKTDTAAGSTDTTSVASAAPASEPAAPEASSSASTAKPADSPDAASKATEGSKPASDTSAPAPSEPSSASGQPLPGPDSSSSTTVKATDNSGPMPKPADNPSPMPAETSAKPATGSSEAPMGLSTAGSPVIPSQAASAASREGAEKFESDPRISEPGEEAAASGTHYLPEDAIAIMFGTSRVFDFAQRIKRVSIADTEVADIQVINPHQVMLVAHKPGFTTLAVWDNQGHYEERQVRIEQTGHQQVLLNCTVAEVNRSRLENQGINYSLSLSRAGISGAGLPGAVGTPYSAQTNLSSSGSGGSTSGGILPFGGQLIPLLLSSTLTYGFATDNHGIQTNTFFQFLEDHQLGRILAQPHLLANSGQEAKFLSGGEIPIVIAQALNTTVVFKQFGTSVAFIPTVIGKRDIELVVKPEVSKPDFAQGVQLFGFTVPAFVTRRAETVVRMKENQTLIIAGLILHDKREEINKVPYLGDLPWAGALFRKTAYNDVKTELVMSVTPQIVGALPDGAQVAYPEQGRITAPDIKTTRLSEPDVSRPRF